MKKIAKAKPAPPPNWPFPTYLGVPLKIKRVKPRLTTEEALF